MDDLSSLVRPFLRIDVSGSKTLEQPWERVPGVTATASNLRYSEAEVAGDMVRMPTHTFGFCGFARNASARRNRAGLWALG